MVTRHYTCDDCEFEEEVEQRISEGFFIKCPNCDGKLSQVYYSPDAYVYNDPKTLQLLAERNSQKMGRQRCEEETAKHKQEYEDRLASRGIVKPKGTPFWRSGKPDLSLANLTPEKRRHYMETGEK